CPGGFIVNSVPAANGPSRWISSIPAFQVFHPATSRKRPQICAGVAEVSMLCSPCQVVLFICTHIICVHIVVNTSWCAARACGLCQARAPRRFPRVRHARWWKPTSRGGSFSLVFGG